MTGSTLMFFWVSMGRMLYSYGVSTIAEKFGVVWVFDFNNSDEQVIVNKKASSLLSHYCSIITSLAIVFPKKPLDDGAHEIQSFCLGIQNLYLALSFVALQSTPMVYLSLEVVIQWFARGILDLFLIFVNLEKSLQGIVLLKCNLSD